MRWCLTVYLLAAAVVSALLGTSHVPAGRENAPQHTCKCGELRSHIAPLLVNLALYAWDCKPALCKSQKAVSASPGSSGSSRLPEQKCLPWSASVHCTCLMQGLEQTTSTQHGPAATSQNDAGATSQQAGFSGGQQRSRRGAGGLPPMFPVHQQQQQQLLQAAMLSPFLANSAAAGKRLRLGLRGAHPYQVQPVTCPSRCSHLSQQLVCGSVL